MAQRSPEKISQLDELTAIDGSAIVPVVQSGRNYYAQVGNLVPVLTYTPSGASDQKTAFQAAINRAIASNRRLEVGNGTVSLASGGISISGALDLRLSPGTTIDFSACASGVICLSGTGSEGTQYSLSANAAKGAASVTLSAPDAATFAFGDLARVASGAQFDPNDTDSEIGEIVRVVSVAGTTVAFEAPLRGGPYSTADSAFISKITPLKNVRISGGRILGGGTLTAAGSDKDHTGIRLDLAERCLVEDVTFERTDLQGVWLRDSIFCQVNRCHFRDFINDQQAYGVATDNACQDCIIDGCTGERVRHLFTTTNSTASAGITRRILVSNCKLFASATARGGTGGDAFDTHTAAEDITFSNCVSYGSTGSGFNAECPSVSFLNCEAYNSAEYAFHHKNESDVEGDCTMIGCKSIGNTLECFRVDVGIRGTVARYRNIKIQDCASLDSASMSFYVVNSLGSTTQRAVSVVGCSSIGCASATSAFYLENCENVTFTGNVVGDPTNAGAFLVRFRDCINVTATGNTVTGTTSATGAAFWANASGAGTCSKITFSGNRAGCTTPSGFRGIVIDNNTQNCVIGQNDFQELAVQFTLGSGAGHRLLQSPSLSSDKGNANFTVLHYSDQTTYYDTPITADRTVTLPSANVRARFRVTRSVNCTGAFNVLVGPGATALAAASTWADVESDGVSWRVTGKGTL